MKLKLLFSAFLIFSGSAVISMDKPQTHDAEFMQNGIDLDDICLVCHKSANNIPRDERCITSCCKKFICAEDAQSILSSVQNNQWAKDAIKNKLQSAGFALTGEQFKRMYKIAKESLNNVTNAHSSNCSQKLTVSTTFLKKPRISKPTLTVIDAEEKKFPLSRELSTALLECSSLEPHDDTLITHTNATVEPIDYSGDIRSDKKRFLKQDLIIKLAQLINDPIKELPHMVHNLEFFELADYLTAPNNILYLIANELWPLMQDQKDDTESISIYKKSIRRLAQPHFSSPKHRAAYSLAHCFSYKFHLINSSNHDANNQLKNGGWYQDNNNQWYKIYPYCTLDGIDDLYGSTCTKLNLSGHRLATLTGDILKNIRKTEYRNPIEINFDNNPISCIDESFFKELAKKRSEGIDVDISLQNTRLTPAQKTAVNQKFHNATTTLPQRYISEFKYNWLARGAGCLGAVFATYYLSQKSPALISGTSVISSGIMGAALGGLGGALVSAAESHSHRPYEYVAILGGFIGGISCGRLAISSINEYGSINIPTYILGIPLGGYVASQLANNASLTLAKRSHPEIKRGDYEIHNIVWKNNYKIIL